MAIVTAPQKLVITLDSASGRSLFVFTGWISFPPGGEGAGGDLQDDTFEVQIPDSGEFNNGWPSGMVVVASPSSFACNDDGLVAVNNATVTAQFPFGLMISGNTAIRNGTIFLVAYQVTAWLKQPQ